MKLTLRLIPLFSALALLTASSEGCIDVELVNMGRKIALDVCTGEPQTPGKGGTTDCHVDFGGTDLSVRVTKKITISNVGEDELAITGYEFTGTSDPAFAVEYLPTTIKAGISSEMAVSFRPLLESSVGADIVLKTTAQNARDPNDGDVTIHLGGAGADNGLPELQVDVVNGDTLEGCCDLGFVAVGSIGTCRVRLTNTGTRPLVLDEVAFDPTETTAGVWTPVGALPTPGDHSHEEQFSIPAHESQIISFRFQPTDVTTSRARVVFRTNAPRACGPIGAFADGACSRLPYTDPCPTAGAGAVTVDFRGQGAQPPECVARIKTVNGSANFDPRLIEPLDDVQLTAEDSRVSVSGLTITSYRWEITQRPPGSNVRFDSDVSVSPHFVFDNTSTRTIVGLDVVGEYVVRCEAVDSQGTKSINDGEAILAINATPSEAIHLQLVWDAPDTDVDLHMVMENAGHFDSESGYDCYFANCKPSAGGAPEWDATAGRTDGDPVLDVDDVEGYGPENSNVQQPIAGRYLALVHYYSDHSNGPTVATLRVYVYGNLVAEYTRLIQDGEYWQVGVVEWPGTAAPTWTELDAMGQP
ncbi:MAG: choice-of-anchor D domain-containing protein [Deltaproteobacteria bacterium]|nr:choice-of-anchor D domain-containing protein [Deltaproteobacteria bacterium]